MEAQEEYLNVFEQCINCEFSETILGHSKASKSTHKMVRCKLESCIKNDVKYLIHPDN
jgi:hypothetical protein